ncbi:hypothetical protein HaLaN_31563, partial [Haematococcus lacustris]
RRCRAEQPDLLDLLHTRLLPGLVVCLEPLTVQELAWATDCEADTDKVLELVGHVCCPVPCQHTTAPPPAGQLMPAAGRAASG